MPFLHYKNGNSWINGVDIFYPVGTIYTATNATSPAEMFGGTWSPLTDGRFLRPMGSYNSLGGTTEHYHYTGSGYYAPEDRFDITSVDTLGGLSRRVSTIGAWTSVNADARLEHPQGHPHTEDPTYKASTLPVYRTVYCWIRTA